MHLLTKQLWLLFEEMDLIRGYIFDPVKQAFFIPRHCDKLRFIVGVQASEDGTAVHFQSAFELDPPSPTPPALWLIAGRLAADHPFGRLIFSDEDRAAVTQAVLDLSDGQLGPLQLRKHLDWFTDLTARAFGDLRRLLKVAADLPCE